MSEPTIRDAFAAAMESDHNARMAAAGITPPVLTPATQHKLSAHQITAIHTSARHHRNGIKGSLRTLRSLERRGLACVMPGYYNVFQLTEAGVAWLAAHPAA